MFPEPRYYGVCALQYTIRGEPFLPAAHGCLAELHLSYTLLLCTC